MSDVTGLVLQNPKHEDVAWRGLGDPLRPPTKCEQCEFEGGSLKEARTLFWFGDGQVDWSDAWYCRTCMVVSGERIGEYAWVRWLFVSKEGGDE